MVTAFYNKRGVFVAPVAFAQKLADSMLVTDIRDDSQRAVIRGWRRGRITMRGGKLVSIAPRWWSLPTSIARVWWQERFRPGAVDQCQLDYRSSRLGGFIVVDFIQSGPGTQLDTFRGACQMLDEIACIREAVAIVAHVSTTSISDRLLRRWGWQPHAHGLSGRHWIKRFYDGYQEIKLDHYLPSDRAASHEREFVGV